MEARRGTGGMMRCFGDKRRNRRNRSLPDGGTLSGVLVLPAIVVCAGLLSACSPMPSGSGVSPTSAANPEAFLVPPGFGSLRQEAITLTLNAGDVQVKVTPLEEWVIRLAAPDTYQRLSSLAELNRSELEGRRRLDGAALFLVSFYSLAQGQSFQPEDVFVENGSRRYQPATIRPVTGNWGTQRLRQRETQTAVYAYDSGVDLRLDLTVEYAGVRNGDWTFILQRLEAERARARVRAGVRGGVGTR